MCNEIIFRSKQTSSKVCCYKIITQNKVRRTGVSPKKPIVLTHQSIINTTKVVILDDNIFAIFHKEPEFEYDFTTRELLGVSEKVLSRDWLSPEEDEAWQDL